MTSRALIRMVFVCACALLPGACGPGPAATRPIDPPPLPEPISNNAVAAAERNGTWTLYSFLGIDTTRTWEGLTTASYAWDVGASEWREIPAPPGPGRLASTAQTVGGRVFLFGGYTVAEDGSEASVPQVDVLEVRSETWSRAAPIPVPVDDAVSGVWRDSLIYLISGWHDFDNVRRVQIYDPARDVWQQGSPIPGPPVFGHAGAIGGDAIVYIDGTRVDHDPRAFVLEPSSWLGRIDPANPSSIEWHRLTEHPGPPLYRAGAIGLGESVLFAGGTDNPYNYNGLGYDGNPARPRPLVFAFDIENEAWIELDSLDVATMDHRGLVRVGASIFSIGGMTAGQHVTRRVARIR